MVFIGFERRERGSACFCAKENRDRQRAPFRASYWSRFVASPRIRAMPWLRLKPAAESRFSTESRRPRAPEPIRWGRATTFAGLGISVSDLVTSKPTYCCKYYRQASKQLQLLKYQGLIRDRKHCTLDSAKERKKNSPRRRESRSSGVER